MDSLRILASVNLEMQWVVEMLDITPPQDNMPAYEGFSVDSEGNLWVADARRPNTPTPSWNGFDREGVWLGHVEGPTGLLGDRHRWGLPAGIVVGRGGARDAVCAGEGLGSGEQKAVGGGE